MASTYSDYLCVMVNRSVAPPFNEIVHLFFSTPEKRLLSQDIPLILLPGPAEGLLKLEVIFLAGRMHELTPMTARASCRLLREGTRFRSSADIGEDTDRFGGTISSSDSMDHNGLVLQCLTRFLPDLLPIFSEMLLHPSFPERELHLFIRNNALRLEEDLAKNEVVAYRELTALLFGQDHPYGYNSTPELYQALTREEVMAFWTNYYRAGHAMILLSGQYDESVIQAIDELICRPMRPGFTAMAYPEPEDMIRQTLRLQANPSLQSAIRIGRRLFHRHHPDYHAMQAVNLVLGGYFGSRLMAQIREELGLTYNIYSHIDAMRYDGYFYISAEVSKEEAERTLKEIYLEVERMRDELVEEEELLMMQRFAAGNMLHLLDGPFSKSETLRNLLVDGVDESDFNRQVQAIRQITPEEIRHLARLWLDPGLLTEVVAG